MSGENANGYRLVPFPGLNGFTQADRLARVEFGFEHSASGSDVDLEWLLLECPIFLVDANEDEICFSSVSLERTIGPFQNGETVFLPITDQTVYPTVFGVFGSGYDFVLSPGGISVGVAKIGVTAALDFDSAFVTLGGVQYGLRCGLDNGIITSPAAFSGGETVIDFEGFADGDPITTQYAGSGVTFSLADGGAPKIATDGSPREYGPAGFGSLDNIVAVPGPVLVLDFDCAVERIGFEIRTFPADDLLLTLICANDGVVCAEQCFDTDLTFAFVGMEGEPFNQVTINVSGGADGFSRLDNLRFECAVPPVGSIAGTVTADCPTAGTGLLGVDVDAYELGTGDLIANASTDASGNYQMDDIPTGDYTVTMVTPLGYAAAADEISVTVAGGAIVDASFDLSCVDIIANPRTIGFWKHQVGVATGGKGNGQIDGASLCDYLDLIDVHFNTNAINEVVVYVPPGTGVCNDKLLVAKTLLNLKGNVGMTSRARQQLMALLMNVASGKLSLDRDHQRRRRHRLAGDYLCRQPH